MQKLPEIDRSALNVEPGEVVFVLTNEELDLPKNIHAVLTLQRHIVNFIIALQHLICYIFRNISRGGRLCYLNVGQKAMYFLFQSFP